MFTSILQRAVCETSIKFLFWLPLQREMLLERGQVRLAQNSANHQKHNEEIALGIALGPVSELHR